MKKHFSLSAAGVLLAAFALILAACGAAPSTPVPTTAPTKAATAVPPTVAPTAEPVQPTSAPATATAVPPTATLAPTVPPPTETPAVSDSGPTVSAQSGYDGDWEGTSSTDSPIQFTVKDNQITSLTINYSYQSGSCSVGAGTSGTPENAPIKGKDLAAQIADSDGVQYSIAGSFTSDTEASGSLEVKGKTFCGDTDTKATWTAKKTSAASASGDSVTPTAVAEEASPTVESSIDDPKNVLAVFFLGIDTKRIDDALAVVSDHVVFQIGPTSGIGKVELKTYLQDQVDKGVVYAGSNITAAGNVITFSVQASGGAPATYNNSSIVVEEGKITVLTLQ